MMFELTPNLDFVYLNPPPAELLGSVTAEPTDVRANHRHPKQSKIQYAGNRVREIVPRRRIIPGPVRRVLPRPDERRPRQHERSLPSVIHQRIVRRPRLQPTIQVMCIVLAHIPEVDRGSGNCFIVDGPTHAGVVNPVGWVVESVEGRGVDKIGNLVHVDPQAVDGDSLSEYRDLSGPEHSCSRVQEIREIDQPGPHLSQVVSSIPLEENSISHSPLECIICVVFDELLHLCCRKVHRVESEVLERVHVVDIGPHYFEGDLGFGIACDDAFEVQ
ncbi:hypothetical protein ACMD2_02730 [Ananas comosus]|uniref:Uncharacterized protein n=1 Tax=Ananas comosus TaxID=4615 RepID=A0A199V3I9_ANACO|nr:hypothetical protein ACMD2_02730 [Ananas comosus]